jgi:RNA:NAD 2'-phosphotransferase (TPT1/KptA family)
MLIRAVQGHSSRAVREEVFMEPLTVNSALPEFCVHGTYYEYLDMRGPRHTRTTREKKNKDLLKK